VFLSEDALSRLGFREVARAAETRLAYRALGREHPVARYVDPAPAVADVTVRHAYNCPLLYATRRAAAQAAQAAGLSVDQADAQGAEAGLLASGKRLPSLPAAPDVLLSALVKRPR
jgi:hypothetical protein